jgi:hypothetical protein
MRCQFTLQNFDGILLDPTEYDREKTSIAADLDPTEYDWQNLCRQEWQTWCSGEIGC